MEEEDRPRVWLLYGWFSGLMCVGSVFGSVAWAAWMQFLVAFFTANTPGLSPAQKQSLYAQAQHWIAAFYVTCAIEFLCLSVAKLLVLHRMADVILTLNRLRLSPGIDATDLAVAKRDITRRARRWAVRGRVVMAAVVVGNVVGLCGNVATAVLSKQTADLNNAAATAFAANSTEAANAVVVQATQSIDDANDAASVQQFCEVAVLLIIILVFAVVGISSARRVSSALRDMNDENGAAGRQMRRQIVGTTALVFVTFLLRAVFSTMNAFSNTLQIRVPICSFCDACNDVWTHMQYWLVFTPEFQLSVVLISSPLSLIVALWGMTSEGTLHYMRSGRGQLVIVRDMRSSSLESELDVS